MSWLIANELNKIVQKWDSDPYNDLVADLHKLVERSKETFEMDGRTWPRLSREKIVSELASILNNESGGEGK